MAIMNRRELLKNAGKLLAVFGLAGQVEAQPESTTELFVDEGVRFSISDALAAIDPDEVPMLRRLGEGYVSKQTALRSYFGDSVADELLAGTSIEDEG